MILSPHFSLAELTITQVRGVDNTPSPEVLTALKDTAERLEEVRLLLDSKPVLVNSGYRSKAVNHLVGGAVNSAHISGHAADFICPGFGSPLSICRRLSSSASLSFDQLIEEGTWVHISFDPRMRNEVLTKTPGGGYQLGLPR